MRVRAQIHATAVLLAASLCFQPASFAAQEGEPATGGNLIERDTDALPEPVEKVVACMEANAPKRSAAQKVEIRHIDRVGQEAKHLGKIYVKRVQEGERRVKLCIEMPPEERGTQVLAVEQEDEPEVFTYLPELRKTRRIVADSMNTSILGMDVSYEDFTRWQQIDRPQAVYRTADAVVADRPVYVLESRPDPESGSSYEKVVNYVDKETCVSLKVDSFGPEEELLRVMTADPKHVEKQGELWVPMQVQFKDVLENTSTEVEIKKVDIDPEIDDREFWPGDLGRYCR